jgi:predicted RND superfamily exporter protein
MNTRLRRLRGRRVRLVAIGVSVLALAFAILALLRLEASGSPKALVDDSSDEARATERLHRTFGDEPVTILVRGRAHTDLCEPTCSIREVLLSPELDVTRILALEGCLAANVPARGRPLAPPCAELARIRPFASVVGPATFVNDAVGVVSARLARARRTRRGEAARAAIAARAIAAAQGLSRAEQDRAARRARQLVYAQIALRYGIVRTPALNDPDFVQQLVFEPSLGADTPKPRFAYLFPSRRSALIRARLRDGLTSGERRRTLDLVRSAVADPRFELTRGEYRVDGTPPVQGSVTDALPADFRLVTLLALALIALVLIFARPLSPIPLLVALAVLALELGGVALVGGALDLGTVAASPAAAAVAAAFSAGTLRAQRPRARDTSGRLSSPARAAVVGAAAALGMLLSPVPAVRSFGLLVALASVLALPLTVLFASLRRGAGEPEGPLPDRPRAAEGAEGTRERIPRRIAARWSALSVRRPGTILVAAIALAALGFALDSNRDAVTGLDRLGPTDREERDARATRSETGFAGDASVLVQADDVTAPTVVRWLAGYQREVLARHGYSDERPCRSAELCPELALSELAGGRARPADLSSEALGEASGSFSRAVISRDRKLANVAFAMRALPPDGKAALVDDMRARLDPPAGVEASLAGLAVLEADSAGDIDAARLPIVVLALALAFAALMIAGHSARQASGAAAAAALAAGVAGLVASVLDLSGDPLSAAAGALVVAAAALVALPVGERYAQAPSRESEAKALAAAYASSLGRRLTAPSALAVAGVLALLASDMRMLRDFGWTSTVEVAAGLAATLAVLPALLVWLERLEPLRMPRSRRELAAAGQAAFERLRAGVEHAGRAAGHGVGVGAGRAAATLRRGARAARDSLRAATRSAPGALRGAIRSARARRNRSG